MKGIWRTNPYGGPTYPAWDKFAALGVTDFYVPALLKDPTTGKYVQNYKQVKPSYRDDVINSHHLGYRIYRDPSWTSITDPQTLVNAASADMMHAAGPGIYVPYMFDIEYHDPAFVEEVLKRFREKWPKGPVAWTLEPNQGGWFTQSLVDTINKDINCVVVPQNFYGNMTPADIPIGNKIRNGLIVKGLAENRVKVFYDAQRLPSTWDGCILSEERL